MVQPTPFYEYGSAERSIKVHEVHAQEIIDVFDATMVAQHALAVQKDKTKKASSLKATNKSKSANSRQ
jgi:hypothetical protein